MKELITKNMYNLSLIKYPHEEVEIYLEDS